MNWKTLDRTEIIDEIKEDSIHQPILIFKHSTRCSISSMALNRLERDWNPEQMKSLKVYFLDLIRHKEISNAIAKTFNVQHQSPQVLLIKDGKCTYDNSHMGISYRELSQQMVDFA